MIRTTAILLAAMFSATSLAVAAEQDVTPAHEHQTHDAHATSAVHQAHDAHGTVIAPPEGTLWPTDEPLRTAMSRIEAAVDRAVAAQPLERKAAHELAGTVEQNVAYMVENCKLPPEPDAALHVLIVRMMSAANGLKQDAAADAAVEQLVATVHDYRRTFDHSPASSERR